MQTSAIGLLREEAGKESLGVEPSPGRRSVMGTL